MVGWHDETRRTVPAGTVEDRQSDGAEADGLANFSQMLVRASMLTLGMTNAAPVPRAGQMGRPRGTAGRA